MMGKEYFQDKRKASFNIETIPKEIYVDKVKNKSNKVK